MNYLIAILFALAVIDLFFWKIPHAIIFPAIIFGLVLTKNIIPFIAMFALASIMYQRKFWAGGDVKLVGMVAAFVGWLSLPIFLTTLVLIKCFRKLRDNYRPLPVAPFMFVATIGITNLFQLWKVVAP